MFTVNEHGKEFPPNRSKRNLLILYIACGVFIFIGLILTLPGLAKGDPSPIGLAVTGFATLLLIIGHFFTSPLNVHYFVGRQGLVLQQRKTILSIPYPEIESLTRLEEKQGEALLMQLQNQLSEKQLEMVTQSSEGVISGIKSAFQEQKKAYEKYKFLSVPIAYTSRGRQRGPDSTTGADLTCDTIFILMKSGEGYLISPLDIEGFMAEARKNMSATTP